MPRHRRRRPLAPPGLFGIAHPRRQCAEFSLSLSARRKGRPVLERSPGWPVLVYRPAIPGLFGLPSLGMRDADSGLTGGSMADPVRPQRPRIPDAGAGLVRLLARPLAGLSGGTP